MLRIKIAENTFLSGFLANLSQADNLISKTNQLAQKPKDLFFFSLLMTME